MPPLPFSFNRGLCFSALPTQVLLCSSRESASACYLMTQKANGEFKFSEPYMLRRNFKLMRTWGRPSASQPIRARYWSSIILKIFQRSGHNEGVIGTLEYEPFNGGLSTASHPAVPRYYITAGYGTHSDVIDSVRGHQRSFKPCYLFVTSNDLPFRPNSAENR